MTHSTVFTIGHSNHTSEKLLELLQAHGITAVADVRSSPYSRFNPSFNREILDRSLKEHGMAYIYLGAELGARSRDPDCYEDGRVQYGRIAQTDLFQAGLKRIIQEARSHRLALLCAEKDPLDCHRTLLVGRELEAQNVSVSHILPDGRLEAQADSMIRLLDKLGMPRLTLFDTMEDLIGQACARQEKHIAYVDQQLLDSAE